MMFGELVCSILYLCVISVVFVLFFFFKQKTAYEMRISDWSSDVCSSDLQLKVMSAIENCRTVALGGHVETCEDCGHWRIAYNSCRNRHCPKCQGAAARAWLAEREADLLPVGYFHVVFTLPAEIDRKSVGKGKSVSVSVDPGGSGTQ